MRERRWQTFSTACYSKSIGLLGPRSRIADTDPRKRSDFPSQELRPSVLEPEIYASGHVNAVQRPIDIERAAEASGSIDQLAVDLHRPDQDRRRVLGCLGHYIQAMVHTVNQIDIGDSRRTEQHVGPGRPSLRCMAGFVVRSDIGLDLDDLPRDHPL